jgi:quinol monooxygenase YgiN
LSAVLYEVTLRVQRGIADDYRTWLDHHVREMLALPGFLDARVSRLDEPAPGADEVVFCCHYRLRDAAALDDYLREHAARMRADGAARFGERFSTSRRVLTVLSDY